MAASPVNTTGNRNNASLPPKRGKIRAQIYASIIETLTSAASKAGEAFGLIKTGGHGGGGGGVGGGRGGSASTSPPDSAYPSDGYANHD